MEKDIEQLKTILAQESDLHTLVIVTAQELSAAIKAQEIVKIRQLTAAFDQYAVEVEALEEKRLASCDAIGKLLNCKPGHITLSTIINHLQGAKRDELSTIRLALKEKIRTLSQITLANQILLEDKLQRVALEVRLYTTMHDHLCGYKSGGTMRTDSIRRTIFNQTA
jgi:hypothetical protein